MTGDVTHSQRRTNADLYSLNNLFFGGMLPFTTFWNSSWTSIHNVAGPYILK